MKIGIDINSAIGKKAGIGYYTESLVKALAKIDQKNEYFLYTPEMVEWQLGKNFHQVIMPKKSIISKVIWFLKIFVDTQIRNSVDVFLSPNSLPIATMSFIRKNVVLSIMDIVPYKLSKTAELRVRLLFLQLPLALRISKEILTISNATKQDLLSELSVPESKITVTHLATHDWCFGKATTEDILRVRKLYTLPENYFLFISTLEPRKNVPNLIRAFEKFSRADTQGYKLVIGGKKGWLYDEIFHVVEEERVEEKVIFTDYIADEDLLPLYQGASVFTFVPFMEGFGLTPLEAMTCGIPVLTSNTSSLPEVVGDAAITVDPDSVDEIAAGMKRLAEDGKLRGELVKKGYNQAKKFSWEKTAKLTLTVLTNNA